MAREWTTPMQWDNAGTAPSEALVQEGFEGGYKPPAAVFNHAFNTTQNCIEELQTAVDEVESKSGTPTVNIESTDGVYYTGTLDGMTTYEVGKTINVIPNMTSTSSLVKLNINSLGNKNIKQSVSASTSTTVQAANASWFVANKPVLIQWDGTQWRTVGTRPYASDLYGTLAIEKGGTGATTAVQARANLGIMFEATAAKTDTVWAVTTSITPATDELYTLRFIASADYAKDDTLTINGTAYTLTSPNGKALGNTAWAANAIVQLNIDPTNAKAFFNAGGADLSFITATAEQILEGYVGCDQDGEAVVGSATGWITKKVTGTTNFTTTGAATNPFTISFSIRPKAAIIFIVMNYSQYANANYLETNLPHSTYGGRMMWIDGFLKTSTVSYAYIGTITEITDTGIVCNLNPGGYTNERVYIYYELYY